MNAMKSELLASSYRNNAYSSIAIVLHWLMAIALLAQLALGWWMLGLPKSPAGLRAGWFNLHKSIGLCILLLGAMRIAWNLRHRVAMPTALPRWQQNAARVTHVLLLVCMMTLPLTGLLGSLLTQYPVRFFGVVLPLWHHDWPAAKELMSQVHKTLVFALMALVALHVGAALWHWLRRDGVSGRMALRAWRN